MAAVFCVSTDHVLNFTFLKSRKRNLTYIVLVSRSRRKLVAVVRMAAFRFLVIDVDTLQTLLKRVTSRI